MFTIPIIIPFYKNQAQLDQCVQAIKAQEINATVEIYIRDNTNDNILFTAAVNEGIRQYVTRTDIPYILVINQDAYLHPTALAEMCKIMEANPRCGIVSPLQVGPKDPEYVVSGAMQSSFPVGRCSAGHISCFTQDEKVHWSSGCCMLLRTMMIREIGLLDENMRFICSDSDYSLTARARGWSIYLSHKAIVVHEEGASKNVQPNNPIEIVKLKDVLFFTEKWATNHLFKKLECNGENLKDDEINDILNTLKTRIETYSIPVTTS
jgi:GT2 family glycosyltransferase